MSRTTREFSTPVEGHKVVILDYLTGADKKEFSAIEEGVKQTDFLIDKTVVTVDDSNENIKGVLEQFHGKDYDFVLAQILKVVRDSSYTEKNG